MEPVTVLLFLTICGPDDRCAEYGRGYPGTVGECISTVRQTRFWRQEQAWMTPAGLLLAGVRCRSAHMTDEGV
jgi:hypothetical protein